MVAIVETSASAQSSWRPVVGILLATAVSLVLGGYIPIWNNNIYHLPILTSAYDLPQFQSDPFVQSLRNFSSGFWMAFAGAGRFVDPKLFLGVWLTLTHLMFFAAAVHLARSLGYREPRFLTVFAVFLGLASLTFGESAGGAGITLEGFTHSELANASLLAAFSFALSRRYGLAVFFGCVTFFLNAFMAVWMALPLLCVAIHHVRSGEIGYAELGRRALFGLPGLLLVLPVIGNIVGNREGLAATDFSYSDFLWSFYPPHFFVTGLTWSKLVEGVALFAGLALSIRAHANASRGLWALAIGALGVLAIGIAVPHLTDSRSILNLHLIRSFIMLHMLAEISMVLFALSRIWFPRERNDRAIGLSIAGLLMLPRPFWIPAVLVLIFDRFGGRQWVLKWKRDYLGIAAMSLFCLCIAALPVRIYRKTIYTQKMTEHISKWEELGAWARANTPVDSRFLISPLAGNDSAIGFSYRSERQVWIDSKYGAAVMWSPSYHAVWKDRYDTLASLTAPSDILAYAKARNIDYVAAPCVAGQMAIHSQADLCIYEGRERAR